MPQLLGAILIGGVVWLAWRALRREMTRVEKELDRQDSATDATRLEQDSDGVYRPKNGD